MSCASAMVQERSMEALPDDILLKILEIGIDKSILSCHDICSVSVCSKRFNKLANDDALWSMFLTLDFPEYKNDVVSCSKMQQYKFGLARWYKRKMSCVVGKLDEYHDRISYLQSRINMLRKDIVDPRKLCGELLDLIKQRNFLCPDVLDETARARVEEATTKTAQWKAWTQVMNNVTVWTSLFASPAPASTPSSDSPVASSSFSDLLVDISEKISSYESLHKRHLSTFYKNEHKHGILRRLTEKRIAELAALDYRLVLLGTEAYDIENYEDNSDDDYDSEDNDYYYAMTSDDEDDDDPHAG